MNIQPGHHVRLLDSGLLYSVQALTPDGRYAYCRVCAGGRVKPGMGITRLETDRLRVVTTKQTPIFHLVTDDHAI